MQALGSHSVTFFHLTIMLAVILPFLLYLGSTSALPYRTSRSLEPPSYIAPGEPYLPPNAVPVDTKDYLPPLSLPINEAADFVGSSVSTHCSGGDCEQAISVSVHAEPCQGDQQPCQDDQHFTPDQPAEDEGYFYPKPSNPLLIPTIHSLGRTIEEGIPLNEDLPTTTLSAETETPAIVSSDVERARRGTSKLQTTPEYGPVRISTLPFNLKKTADLKPYVNKKPIHRKEQF